jgi:hypothetical protein
MKKVIVLASLVALLVPGAAFAGASTDAALGLGAFAVFNQIISGTGIFGAFVPAPRVVLPVPAPPVVLPAPVIAPPRVPAGLRAAPGLLRAAGSPRIPCAGAHGRDREARRRAPRPRLEGSPRARA